MVAFISKFGIKKLTNLTHLSCSIGKEIAKIAMLIKAKSYTIICSCLNCKYRQCHFGNENKSNTIVFFFIYLSHSFKSIQEKNSLFEIIGSF